MRLNPGSGLGRNAALFVAISVVSGFGGNAMSLATGVWVLDLTRSSGLAALAGLGGYAPQLAGPWLGGLLDRVPRRQLVVTVDLVMAAVLLSLYAVTGAGRVWIIFVVALVYGVSHVLRDAGETALLVSALVPDRLADVNGWRSSTAEGMKLVAPLAGTGLYAWGGGGAVATLSAGTLVASAALYSALRLPEATGAAPGKPGTRAANDTPGTRPDGPVPGSRGDGPVPGSRGDSPVPGGRGDGVGSRSRVEVGRFGVPAGLALLWSRREVRVATALAAVAIGVSGFQIAATYHLVAVGLGLPARYLGLLTAAQGAGSIVAGLLAGRFVAARGPVAVAVAGTVLFAAAGLLRCVPWWPVTLATGVITGVGLPWTLVAAVTAVQTYLPAGLLGRAAATANTVMFGPLAVAIPLGSAAVALGSVPPLVAGSLLCLAAAAATARRVRGRLVPRGRGGAARRDRGGVAGRRL